MRLTRCFLNLIISSCNPLPHLFLFIVFPFFFFTSSTKLSSFKTPLSLTWWTPSRMPSGQDTAQFLCKSTRWLYLPCQNKRKHFNEFFFFILKSTREHLFPPRQEAEDMSRKNKKASANFFTYWESFTRTKEREKNKNKHLTGMFSLKKKKPSPYRSNINIIIITTRLFNTLVPPTPQALILFQTFRTPTHTHTHTYTLLYESFHICI